MKKIILFSVLITLLSCKVQQNQTATKKKGSDLIGFVNKASFNEDSYSKWFDQEKKLYQTDSQTITSLKEKLKGIKIKGFLGTWCGDSRREIPRFFKILDQAGFNLKNVELIAVNRNKKTPDNLQEGFNIIRVPTFVFYKQGKEIGRYVEYAKESLEKDMLQIISEQPYKHAYEN